MYRRIIFIFLAMVLLLSGCSMPGFGKDNETKKIVPKAQKGSQGQAVQITPNKDMSSPYYRTVAKFQPGAARGHILFGVDNRLDIDAIETGLIRLSQPTFSPDDYVFQEGQYLSSDTIEGWLESKNSNKDDNGEVINPDGLAPELPSNWEQLPWQEKEDFYQKHPTYLSYIVEQNYLKESSGNQLVLGGITLGLSMNQVFSYKVEDKKGLFHNGEVPLANDQIVAAAKEAAGVILQRIREINALKNVPVVIALYQEQTAESVVPGHFFAKAVAPSGDTKISKWEEIHESHFLFPAEGEAVDSHEEDVQSFNQFRANIRQYFPNFIGVVGKGFYQDGKLRQLTVHIPIKFYDEAEVISFTQYLSGLVSSPKFPFAKSIPVDITISSTAGPEALIVRKGDGSEPFIHIYH